MTSRKIVTIYVLTNGNGLADEVRQQLKERDIDIQVKDVSESELKDLADDEVEYVYGKFRYVIPVLSRANNQVKWFQTPSAGVDEFLQHVHTLKLRPDFVMTRTAARECGRMMGEYVIGHVIARERSFVSLAEAQKRGQYDRSVAPPYRMLTDLTVGVLGVGCHGVEVAKMCRAVGMTVWAGVTDSRFEAKTTPTDIFDNVLPMSRLSELLSNCDYVITTLPSTSATRGLLSGDVLRACQKKQTVLINLGRGDLIDDDSLIKAISNGYLGGAILDVLNQEPLASDNPLWSSPYVTITPHNSCHARNNRKVLVSNYVENVYRYITGQTLDSTLDLNKGY